MTTLKSGDKGKRVIQLQILLNGSLKPSPRLKADGVFGKKTQDAVKRLQQEKKLSVDGVVGKNTWAVLGIKPKPSSTPNVMEGPPWYKIAQAEAGIREIAGTKHTKRIIEYHSTTTLGAKTDEVPWCSSFVNWVVIQAGIKGTNNALAKSWITWGVKVVNPTPGVITVIKRKDKNKNLDTTTGSSTGYHVGFFQSSTATTITLLGGNQSNQVKSSTFYLKSYEVVAYRVPLTTILNYPNMSEIRDFGFYC